MSPSLGLDPSTSYAMSFHVMANLRELHVVSGAETLGLKLAKPQEDPS